MNRYNAFKDLINNQGLHPSDAARQNSMDYSIFKNHKPFRYAVKLTGAERAYFTLEDHVVEMQSVGAHVLRGA